MYSMKLNSDFFSFKLLKDAYLKADNDHKKNGGVLISYLKDNKQNILKILSRIVINYNLNPVKIKKGNPK